MPVQRTSYQLVDNHCSASSLKRGPQTTVLTKKLRPFPPFCISVMPPLWMLTARYQARQWD